MIVKPVFVKCDCCGETENTARYLDYSVSEARKTAKERGYVTRKVEDGEKADLCRKCKVTHESIFCVLYQRISGREIVLPDPKAGASKRC